MNKLLYYSVDKILEKGLFNFGVEAITKKSYECDLRFTIQDLSAGLFKSNLIV